MLGGAERDIKETKDNNLSVHDTDIGINAVN